MPCGGGGWFRLYPYQLSHWAIDRVRKKDGERSIFYFHPWEFDPEQPRIDGLDPKTRFRHYQNLSRHRVLLKVIHFCIVVRMGSRYISGDIRIVRPFWMG